MKVNALFPTIQTKLINYKNLVLMCDFSTVLNSLKLIGLIFINNRTLMLII